MSALRQLQEAIAAGDVAAATKAIEEGGLDEPGAPIAQAVRLGLLLDAGAEVDAVDKRDRTALQNAAQIQEHEPQKEHAAAMVEMLLAAGADPLLKTTRKPKHTALSLAAQTGTVGAGAARSTRACGHEDARRRDDECGAQLRRSREGREAARTGCRSE